MAARADSWDRLAPRYDAASAPIERRFFAAARAWVADRAVGEVLELAVGTGRTFEHYGPDAAVTATDVSAGMLALARERAARLGLEARFAQADAARLPFGDGEFDSAVMLFSLCGVDDVGAVVAEAARVLRPGGRLLLADHVAAANPLLRAGQHLLEPLAIALHGERFTRRPMREVRALGLEVVESRRTHGGLIEALHARTGSRAG